MAMRSLSKVQVRPRPARPPLRYPPRPNRLQHQPVAARFPGRRASWHAPRCPPVLTALSPLQPQRTPFRAAAVHTLKRGQHDLVVIGGGPGGALPESCGAAQATCRGGRAGR